MTSELLRKLLIAGAAVVALAKAQEAQEAQSRATTDPLLSPREAKKNDPTQETEAS